MGFARDVAERLLVACHRHCCICHKSAGSKMEIHHIVPKSKGGGDTEENGIPLCFDCHAEAGAYDLRHPKGKRFTPSELRKHKEQWFAICASPPWHSSLRTAPTISDVPSDIDESTLAKLRLDDRKPAQRLAGAIMRQERPLREEFAGRVFETLQSDDEDTRWKVGWLVEELVLWEPRLVPTQVIVSMSRDECFSVRSSAAVCYYYLAVLDPVSVPLDVLSKLARYDEDWYVTTPATSALLRLARARPVVIDILARDLEHQDGDAREHAAEAIRRLAQRDWDLLPDDLVSRMLQNSHTYVRRVGQECRSKRKAQEATMEPDKDYALF